MFVILTYDVSAKRDPKVMKISRKYLSHCQKSVFEGMITESKLKRLKRGCAAAQGDQGVHVRGAVSQRSEAHPKELEVDEGHR